MTNVMSTKSNQIRQLHGLRMLKVDRLQAAIKKARTSLDEARKSYEARAQEYRSAIEGRDANFTALLTATEGIEDAQTRMIAVTRGMARQRDAEIHAKILCDEAEIEIAAAETKVKQSMQALGVAQRRLQAAEHLAEHSARASALRAEEAADDLMQDQYASRVTEARIA